MTVLLALVMMISLVALAMLATGSTDADAARAQTVLIERVNALLPQTQCGRCTFAGCKPYATAVVLGQAGINQCPPGGDRTAAALAELMRVPAAPVDPSFGSMPAESAVAFVDEAACIGCTKCIQACPVDAIVGASRFMHTVIADACTGCELCIPPCPVDCIVMRPASISAAAAQTIAQAPWRGAA